MQKSVCIVSAVYMLCSMAVVALTVISSVVVTNIYQTNIGDCVKTVIMKRKAGPETTGVDLADDGDLGGKEEVEKNEPFDMKKYCEEL